MRVSLLRSKANLDLLHKEFRHIEKSEENLTQMNDKSDCYWQNVMCFLPTRKKLFGYKGYRG
jgi:hypothetical protein